MTVHLKGITWNHSRGYVPMAATAQRFEERNPDVRITWEKRSLQEFADAPISHLVERYDLLVIDHPWAGYAAAHGVLLDLGAHLPEAFMADQAAHSVGASHASYRFGGKQTALAIDAAAPVSSHRPDLMERDGLTPPEKWEELLALARRGRVVMPGIPIDTLMNFYMLCATLGEEPFASEEEVVGKETAARALEMYRELAALCPDRIYGWNPIAVYEAMTDGDDYAYCPFAYGYSNYSRPGYANRPLTFGDLVSLTGHGRLRSTLGGTGLAVSAGTPHREAALRYAAYVADPLVQRTLYVECGGQPGHRAAWEDDEANRRARDYFRRTLPALDRAYVRPRYDGYLHFQDRAGDVVRDYLREGGRTDRVMERLNALYAESLGLRGGKRT
ncbi:extracellular solute-binding protein [Paenibacillus cisolokensis]|uniref:extracellular solute-binding protein n=1 Tax=Paenibacillus cisolokensis TaxID=1658519 RepID=UPI003D2844F7